MSRINSYFHNCLKTRKKLLVWDRKLKFVKLSSKIHSREGVKQFLKFFRSFSGERGHWICHQHLNCLLKDWSWNVPSTIEDIIAAKKDVIAAAKNASYSFDFYLIDGTPVYKMNSFLFEDDAVKSKSRQSLYVLDHVLKNDAILCNLSLKMLKLAGLRPGSAINSYNIPIHSYLQF